MVSRGARTVTVLSRVQLQQQPRALVLPRLPAMSLMQRREASSWSTRKVGSPETLEYRVQFVRAPGDTKVASPWHDLPLRVPNAANLLNYVNEIPKGQRAKMEIATKEAGNPIKQDVKKGQLRFFKYGDIPFNYGALPQTWEDPNTKHALTGYPGDNDPVDVVEISETPLPVGAIVPVKVLGVFGLIDEGETDWKIVAIAQSHPLFDRVNSVADIERELSPAIVTRIREWFREYKVPDGKPLNTFALDEKILDAKVAHEIIDEAHASWRALKDGKIAANGLWLQ